MELAVPILAIALLGCIIGFIQTMQYEPDFEILTEPGRPQLEFRAWTEDWAWEDSRCGR